VICPAKLSLYRMKNLNPKLIAILLSAYILSSCAVKHKQLTTLNLVHFNSYHFNNIDSIQYGYFENLLENLLEHSNNKRLIRWANRKNYQFIGFNVINTSEDFRKGYQLKFYHKGQRLNLVRNEWAAHKAKQKVSAAPFIAVPFIILEAILFNKDKEPQRDEYGFSIYDENNSVSMQLVEADNELRKKANKNLLKDLILHDICHQTLPFGVPVYGIIIIDSKEPLDSIKVSLQ